jgi:hypothetical protein
LAAIERLRVCGISSERQELQLRVVWGQLGRKANPTIINAALMPRRFKPVAEWVSPQVQLHYDVAANRKSVFLEKRLGGNETVESVGGLPQLIVQRFELLQMIWLGALSVVTVYAVLAIRHIALSPLIAFILGALIILGTRLGMMSLIHSYAFHMTDWRYVFSISLAVCLLPFSIIGMIGTKDSSNT